MKTIDIDALRARIEKGTATVRALCVGEQTWVMRVPARPDEDPDLVISDALLAGKEAIAALEAADADGRWATALRCMGVDGPERLFRLEERLQYLLGDAHPLKRAYTLEGDPVWRVGTTVLTVADAYDRSESWHAFDAFARALKASLDG